MRTRRCRRVHKIITQKKNTVILHQCGRLYLLCSKSTGSFQMGHVTYTYCRCCFARVNKFFNPKGFYKQLRESNLVLFLIIAHVTGVDAADERPFAEFGEVLIQFRRENKVNTQWSALWFELSSKVD